MIGKSYLTRRGTTGVCTNIKGVENYSEAFNDKEFLWELHHRDELDRGLTRKELKVRGEYAHLPPEKLIFLPGYIHSIAHFIGHIPRRDCWDILLNEHFRALPSEFALSLIKQMNL
jgi:hypothetical protein